MLADIKGPHLDFWGGGPTAFHTALNICDQPILIDKFYVLPGILIEKCFFRYLVNSMQNQARLTKWHSAINLSMRSTCWPPLVYFSV